MLRKLIVATGVVAALLVGIMPAAAAAATPVAAPHAAGAMRPADDTVIDVTSANYQQVMQMSNSKPVVLDFSATWCEWCQKEKPYLQQYHDQDGGRGSGRGWTSTRTRTWCSSTTSTAFPTCSTSATGRRPAAGSRASTRTRALRTCGPG